MLWMVHSAWRFRKEILLGIQVVAEIRKTARDFTREYLRRRMKEGLLIGLVAVLIQISLLLAALLWVATTPSLMARLAASTLLWVITVYNLYRFFFVTIPEMRAVRKALRGKIGYAAKYLLRISLVTELMQWNLLLPALCLSIAVLTRSVLGRAVSYIAPWVEAFHRLNG